MKVFKKLFLFSAVAALMLTGCGSQPSSNTAANSTKTEVKPTPAPPSTPAAKTETKADTQASEVMARVKKDGVIKVAFEGTYAPFNYLNDKKEFEGFDVDISNEIAKRLGVKAEFVATKWDALIGGLKVDKFDIIISQMSITDERKKSVDFTDPYVITGGVLVTRKDTNDIKKLEDLKGKKVGVGAGTTFEEVARKVQGANITTYKSVNEYLQDLMNKRLDVIINDKLVMGYNIKSKNLPIQIVSDIVNEDNIGMAIKKDNSDFVKSVNKALADMKQDGTYENIYMKWFGVKPTIK